MKLHLFTLVLVLTVTAAAKPTCLTNQTDNWRLPTNVIPTHYELELTTYLPGYGWKEDEKSETFEGTIAIEVNVKEATDRIVLHSASHTIHKHEIISNDPDLQISRIELIPELHFLVLRLNKIVEPQSSAHILIEFSGKLLGEPYGLYLTKSPNPEEGKPERLNAVTQFEATSARFMIPCFDEPEFKATWQVQLTHPTGTTALSNTMDESSQPISDEWIVTNFKRTVIMSSYLLAVFIGDVEFKEAFTERGVRIRVYAPPAYINQTDHALNVSKRTVDYFEQRFNINYPMEKIDFVSANNFRAGAMENWGLIVHRESLIFGNSSSVSDTVIHELAHQWFGNLVTMEFWNNVWLNEAFATYMMGGGRKHLDPSYDIDFERTQIYQSGGFDLAAGYAIRDASRTDDNRYGINFVVYSKGSSFLRMIEKLIGKESFDKAIRWYLFENQYGSTNEQDLYKAFDLFMPSGLLGPDGNRLDIPEFARCWTDQNGYPTIHATVTNNGTIRLTQQMDQLLAKGHRNKGVCGYRWDVPIWYQHGAEAEVGFVWLGRNEHSVELPIEIPVIINLNSDGFYKVSYSNKLFSMQAAALVEAMKDASDSTKYRLLSDSSHFAKEKENNWENVLILSDALVNDTNEHIKQLALLQTYEIEKQLQSKIEDYSKDLAKISEIQAAQPQKRLIGDCSNTIKFEDCFTGTDTDVQIQCFTESRRSGYSIDRLLEYLKTETELSPRLTVFKLISCIKNDVLDSLLTNEQYHLTDWEKQYILDTLRKQDAPKASSRRFMQSDNFLN